jgi:KDO2-lipid IV(A) lauroyltransferase
MEVLPLTGGPNVFGVLAQRLRAGHMVCLLCDRDLTESGVEVDFFGDRARMAAGPAALAVQTGASLRAVTLWFTEDGWYAHASPDIPVPAEGNRKEKAAAMTQQLAAAFEKRISEHPQDWHMLQRVFISDLDPARLAGLQSGPAGTVPDAAVPDAAVPDAAVPDAAGPGSAGPGSTGPEAGG